MTEKYISIDLSDPRSASIAEVLSNKTCKKILSLVSEKDMSEGDIAKSLGLPANTANYNVKKLVSAGLIEKTKDYFWSVKGKKISMYRVSNKRIIISPKTMIKGVVPTVLLSGIAALIINKSLTSSAGKIASMQESASSISSPQALTDAARSAPEILTGQIFSQAWIWFLIGALSSLIIFFAWNWLMRINWKGFK